MEELIYIVSTTEKTHYLKSNVVRERTRILRVFKDKDVAKEYAETYCNCKDAMGEVIARKINETENAYDCRITRKDECAGCELFVSVVVENRQITHETEDDIFSDMAVCWGND